MQRQLCDRDVLALTEHHLIPKQKTKREKADPGSTVDICSVCHCQIHSLFTNEQLAKDLNSLDPR